MGRKVSTLKRGPRRFFKPVGDPADPDGLIASMNRYLEHLKVKGQSEQTLYNVERYLRDFIGWCDGRALTRPQEITKPILESYQRYVFYYRKKSGAALSFASQRGKLTPVKGFFKWLTKNNYLLYNPASELELPRVVRRLPKHVLTVSEVEAVMAQPDLTDPLGLRDRAVLETLYSTGMRRMELVSLQVPDLDRERGTVLICQGKGRKDRLIPIGERALAWIDRYLERVRLHLVVDANDQTLFLTRAGESFNLEWLSSTVARYVERANIGKRGSCHLFRHTMATLMLENGCDIRFIQAMLGHAELSTTQIYTQVAIRVLKQMHAATHPAVIKKPAPATTDTIDSAAAVTDLLAALDAEAEEESGDVVRH
ncbi:MAG TPA: site-specific tyrosine recombinase XerC [Steroidobacteraceae bacterium]|nr:site-specific tyrosine recombinase XerC [Steroidobacteraceae bacterium]